MYCVRYRAAANSKFCNECGAPVTAHDTHAEFKQVTVLFADVVHSMDIAAAVGAERLREIMADTEAPGNAPVGGKEGWLLLTRSMRAPIGP